MVEQALAYSPTSPAADDVSPPPAAVREQIAAPAQEREDEQVRADIPSAFPLLKVGSKLDKELKLRANRWTKIGRDNQAHVFLDGRGVSIDHCMLRWDPYSRRVELKDNSKTGTFVNGTKVDMKTRQAFLQHGDRIGVHTGQTTYVFVLDLRPVGLGLSDPCLQHVTGQNRKDKQKKKVEKLTESRNKAKERIQKLQAEIKKANDYCLELEKEECTVIARRECRKLEMEAMKVKKGELEKEIVELNEHLETSRTAWKQKIREAFETSELEVRGLRDRVLSTQVQLEKLKLKKAELERGLHPEKFQFLEAGGSQSGAPGSSRHSEKGIEDGSTAADDAAGEDQALMDMPLGTTAREDSAAPPVASGSLGDGSDNEPLAKRPKVDEAPTLD